MANLRSSYKAAWLFLALLIALPALGRKIPPSTIIRQQPSPASPKQQKPAASNPSAQEPAPAKTLYDLGVPGNGKWTDTGIDLNPGDRLLITATGTIQYPLTKPSGPEGFPRGFRDLLRSLPQNEAGRGALLGRVGASEADEPFVIGARRELSAAHAGRLFLGLNQQTGDEADGSFQVKVQILERASRPALAIKTDTTAVVAGVTPALLEKIPRRIADKDGNAGDMVNFLMLGSEERVRQAFQAAGWVQVDRSTKEAITHGLLASLSKQAYTQLPMSELYLFNRPQDFGYAHAEPISVAASRHHLRLWKADIEVAGQTLWAGAATHDIGFERDQRNNKLTHKIDPQIDLEREYVAQTLKESGVVTQLTYLRPSHPITEARTATGGSFRSDGRVLVMVLASSKDNNERSGAFADVFCAVLEQEHPDAGEWGACSQYLEAKSERRARLATFPAKYRLLIVPGVLNSCAAAAPAFNEGQNHLREKHGLTVEYLPVPNDSSESNAEIIAAYLKDHIKSDPRKYILLGYSKGAPDIQVALVHDAEAAAAVAAFITVAGAVGGSPTADTIPAQANRYMSALHLGSCQGDLAEGFKSLRRDVRRAFLAAYPDPVVPTYSLAAVSDKSTTSKLLLEYWQILSAFDPREDSQLIESDARVPGAMQLGTARADHLAVALPFEFAQDAVIRAAASHNHYPRTALLEALVRFVAQDLDTPLR